MYVSPDPEADTTILIAMSTTIPLATINVEDVMGQTIYSYMTFAPADWESEVTKKTVVCRSMVGDKIQSSVSQYGEDFVGAPSDVALWPSGDGWEALSLGESFFTAHEDKDEYDTIIEVDTESFAIIKCLIEIVSDRNAEAVEGIFDSVFDVEYGLYLSENENTPSKKMTEDSGYNFQVYIPSPTFDDEWIEAEEEEPMKEATYNILNPDGTLSYMKFAVSLDT